MSPTVKFAPLILALSLAGCIGDDAEPGAASDNLTSGCSDRFERHASYEDNDVIDRATELGATSDGERELFTMNPGVSLSDEDDVDWYQWKALDESSATLKPAVIFSTGPDDRAFFDRDHVQLCGFVNRPADELECLAGEPAQEGQLNGCCADVVDVAGEDMYGFEMDLDTTWGDDSATLYVRVTSKKPLASNACYRLIYTAIGIDG